MIFYIPELNEILLIGAKSYNWVDNHFIFDCQTHLGLEEEVLINNAWYFIGYL